MFSVQRTLRRLLEICARYRWLILFVMWLTGIIYLEQQHETQKDVGVGYLRMLQTRNVSTKPSHYDVILSSYMRSGSTLAGIVLGFRQDTFYVYEPLWKIARWTYWNGTKSVCRSDRDECRPSAVDQTIPASFVQNKDGSPGGSLAMAKKILAKTYDCLFNNFETSVFNKKNTVDLGGPSWYKVKGCINKMNAHAVCINKFVANQCKASFHKVTKVLRLTVDNLESFLVNRPNLKIVHLFRDPRAIINSRIQTSWYPSDNILKNAKTLCSKMLLDFQAGKRLLQLYPDRFRFMYYEDLNDEPFEKVKLLYKFLGMSLDEQKFKLVKNLPVFKSTGTKTEREKNTAFWWRKTLKWSLIQEIDRVCSDVYTALGYVKINAEDDLRNLDLPSVNIPNNYALV